MTATRSAVTGPSRRKKANRLGPDLSRTRPYRAVVLRTFLTDDELREGLRDWELVILVRARTGVDLSYSPRFLRECLEDGLLEGPPRITDTAKNTAGERDIGRKTSGRRP